MENVVDMRAEIALKLMAALLIADGFKTLSVRKMIWAAFGASVMGSPLERGKGCVNELCSEKRPMHLHCRHTPPPLSRG
jgi:hypothetical protein